MNDTTNRVTDAEELTIQTARLVLADISSRRVNSGAVEGRFASIFTSIAKLVITPEEKAVSAAELQKLLVKALARKGTLMNTYTTRDGMVIQLDGDTITIWDIAHPDAKRTEVWPSMADLLYRLAKLVSR